MECPPCCHSVPSIQQRFDLSTSGRGLTQRVIVGVEQGIESVVINQSIVPVVNTYSPAQLFYYTVAERHALTPALHRIQRNLPLQKIQENRSIISFRRRNSLRGPAQLHASLPPPPHARPTPTRSTPSLNNLILPTFATSPDTPRMVWRKSQRQKRGQRTGNTKRKKEKERRQTPAQLRRQPLQRPPPSRGGPGLWQREMGKLWMKWRKRAM